MGRCLIVGLGFLLVFAIGCGSPDFANRKAVKEASTRPSPVFATQLPMSEFAKKLAAGMPKGWRVTAYGRGQAPWSWSSDPATENTACECLNFEHDTAQSASLPGPARLTVFITPADFVARRYETNLTQWGGPPLLWIGRDYLLFMAGGTERTEDWTPVEELIKSLGFTRATSMNITPAAAKVAKRLTVLAAEDKDKKLPGSGLTTAAAAQPSPPAKFAFAAVAKAANEPMVVPNRSGTAYVSQWFEFVEVLAGSNGRYLPFAMNYMVQVRSERPILKGEQVILIVCVQSSEPLVVQVLPDTPANRKALKGLPAGSSRTPASAPTSPGG